MIRKNGYIESIEVISRTDAYPFTVPAIQGINKLIFDERATYIVGNNGSGKSTLLEAIAIGLRINPEGGNKNTRFSILPTESELFKGIVINKTGRVIPDAFFFRAETMFNLQIAASRDYEENKGDSWALHGYLGLSKRSHGESHLDLICNKMNRGLYIFDEPESGLSIERQFQLLCEFKRLVENGSQLIIATHSPVLLAYPDALIYGLGKDGAVKLKYEETDVYKLTKLFMSNANRFVRELFKE